MHHTLIILTLLACLLLPSWLYAKNIRPQLSLAKSFKDGLFSQAYWVSEKLDGIRCYWDGKQLLSRSGNVIHAPAWFVQSFPQTPMDGELWIKRGGYQLITKVVLDKTPNEQHWRKVSYQVFDLPSSPAPFELRQTKLQSLIKQVNVPHLAWVKQEKMNDSELIKKHLLDIVDQGAEGLMLRKPSSLYKAGRSNDLLKFKLRQDAEARVIAYQAGRGKFKGMMGAVWVEMSNGTLFKIGTGFSNIERSNPPPIGSDITYSYQGFTEKGLPRFASFQHIREKE